MDPVVQQYMRRMIRAQQPEGIEPPDLNGGNAVGRALARFGEIPEDASPTDVRRGLAIAAHLADVFHTEAGETTGAWSVQAATNARTIEGRARQTATGALTRSHRVGRRHSPRRTCGPQRRPGTRRSHQSHSPPGDDGPGEPEPERPAHTDDDVDGAA
jgi:hypothetical protein